MARKITVEEQINPGYISFLTAAMEFNRDVKRTPWSLCQPPEVGEWNASISMNKNSKRWWNGTWWSVAYDDFDSEETKQNSRKLQSTWTNSGIEWRGLTEQPITAGFAK